MVGDSLKRMESLADNGSGNKIEICRNIKYSLKTMPFLLDSIREYIAEHEDRELARKFVSDVWCYQWIRKHRPLKYRSCR